MNKNKTIKRVLAVILAMALFLGCSKDDNEGYADFFSQFGMNTSELPSRWVEGYFTGNGELGAVVHMKSDSSAMRWHLGKVDVQDHRSHEGNKDGLPDKETLHSWSWSCFHWTDPRLDIGALELVPEGKITGGSMELDIWNAEIRGVINTTKGSIKFRSLTHSEEMVEIVEYWTSEGERDAYVKWMPASADAPRDQVDWYFKKHGGPEPLPSYVSNPDPIIKEEGGIVTSTQKLLAGGDYATAFTNVDMGKGHHRVYATTVNAVPQEGAAVEAYQAIKTYAAMDFSHMEKVHRDWWHDFYPQSIVKIPDTDLLNFYWIQIYKLGSATRSDRSLIDNTGPWYITNAWAYATWDMNVQLCYWPTYSGNRLELSKSLQHFLERTKQQHIDAVPEEWRYDSAGNPGISNQRKIGGEFAIKGCLSWSLHNIWLQYRYSMDDEMLKDFLFPYLRRATCYYMHLMEKGEDGYYHLPKLFSPEYPTRAEDTTFDLALFRWGCEKLLWINDRFKLNDPLVESWNDVLQDLVPYYIDETGFMVGKDVPFEISHRHHQHMMPFYPLHLVNWDQKENRDLIKRSVDNWLSYPEELEGFSYAGAASFYALMQEPENAVKWMKKLIHSRLHPNTFYTEWEEDINPTIETPISVTVPIHEMMLQSWGDNIKVFPAIPEAWKEVSFQDLRAEGAFLISAKRAEGKTQFIKIESLAGEPCIIEPNIEGDFVLSGTRDHKLEKLDASRYRIDVAQGETLVLHVPSCSDFDF